MIGRLFVAIVQCPFRRDHVSMRLVAPVVVAAAVAAAAAGYVTRLRDAIGTFSPILS